MRKVLSSPSISRDSNKKEDICVFVGNKSGEVGRREGECELRKKDKMILQTDMLCVPQI